MARKAATKPATGKSASGKFAYDPAAMRLVVVHGDDGYLMREYTKQIAEALRTHFGEIEEFSYEGETARLADVLDELRSYGLIQRHKVVILDNADEFMKDPKDEEGGDEADSSRSSHRPAMERYAAAPVDHATLLMRAKTWRKGKIDKLIEKCGMIYKAAAPTEAKAVSWSMRRCEKQYECELKPDAAALLVNQIGPDLARLDVEMAKLAAYVGQGAAITREVVGELVGLSREEKVWSIQSAIATGEPERALAKLQEFQPIDTQTQVLISWSIMDLMRKVHAASQLLRQGVQPFNIGRQLKLWGDTQTAVLSAAKRMTPETAADLLDRAVVVDQYNKSGVGEVVRNLETLMVEIAHAIGQGTGSRA